MSEPLTDEELDWLVRISDEVAERVRDGGMAEGWLDCYPGATSLATGPEVVGVPAPWIRTLVDEVRRLRRQQPAWQSPPLNPWMESYRRGTVLLVDAYPRPEVVLIGDRGEGCSECARWPLREIKGVAHATLPEAPTASDDSPADPARTP